MKAFPVTNPYLWIFLVSIAPTLLWSLLNKDVSSFGLIDSLSLSFFIATTAAVLLRFSRITSALFLCISGLFFTLFTYISFEYFTFYGGYISTETILLFKDLMTASGQFVTPSAALLLLPVGALTYLLVKVISHAQISHTATYKSASVFATCLLATAFSHAKYDSITLRPDQPKKLELESQNPVLFFARSSEIWRAINKGDAEQIEHHNFLTLANGLKKGIDLELPEKYAVTNYQDLLVEYPNYHSANQLKAPLTNIPETDAQRHNQQKNVIMIVLESVRAYETGLFDPEYSITPNLDAIAKQGISLPNFYASNRQTVKAEQALLCSATDYMGEAPYAVKHGVFNGNCLPKILSENGYDTYWFHGYTKDFFNRKQYHKSIGFENIYAKEEFESDGYDSSNDIGWGVPDTILFDTVFDKLEQMDQSNKPFFTEILTLTNHQPFDWNYGELNIQSNRHDEGQEKYKNYQRGIHYTDKALGQFWKKFKQSKFAKNTIVIITADHGVPYYPSEEMAAVDKREILFRIPFVMIDPDAPQPATITTQLSQLDVAPTVLSMLDIRSTNAFIGRPFYGNSATQSDRPILLLSSNGISVRYGQLSCNPVGEMCLEGDDSCRQVGTMQCLTPDDNLLQYGQQAIKYHEYLKLALETGFTI